MCWPRKDSCVGSARLRWKVGTSCTSGTSTTRSTYFTSEHAPSQFVGKNKQEIVKCQKCNEKEVDLGHWYRQEWSREPIVQSGWRRERERVGRILPHLQCSVSFVSPYVVATGRFPMYCGAGAILSRPTILLVAESEDTDILKRFVNFLFLSFSNIPTSLYVDIQTSVIWKS